MEANDRADVADYLTNEAANLQDADFAEKLMGAADALRTETRYTFGVGAPDHDPAGSVTFRAQALWFGETSYPEDHPTQRVVNIASEFAEATSDMLVYLDNAAAVNLEQADGAWREYMAAMLERDLQHVTTLVANAARIIRTLTLEPTTYSIDIAPEPTGNPAIDEAERSARSRLIELLESGTPDPEVDAVYRWLSNRVTELKREEKGR